MTVQELTSEIARQLGISTTKGVVVRDVERNRPADQAGLRDGDIILEVNQRQISSFQDYRAVFDRIKETDRLLFLISRGQYVVAVLLRSARVHTSSVVTPKAERTASAPEPSQNQPTEAFPPQGVQVWTVETTPLRRDPKETALLLDTLLKGTPLRAFSAKEGWYFVTSDAPDRLAPDGWIKTRHVTRTSPSGLATPPVAASPPPAAKPSQPQPAPPSPPLAPEPPPVRTAEAISVEGQALTKEATPIWGSPQESAPLTFTPPQGTPLRLFRAYKEWYFVTSNKPGGPYLTGWVEARHITRTSPR